jgi:alpha-L-fucosidase
MSKYEATWESLQQYTTPQWFEEAKLGIFIHYGVISVPGKGCWYGNKMYQFNEPTFKHHLKTYGPQHEFGYKDFIPMFKAEKFDAHAWIDLCKRAGAKYVVPVADFHDAFAMYDSDLTEYTAVKMGPKRDIIGELKTATAGTDIKFGVSSHLAFNWEFFPHERTTDTGDPANAAIYGVPHDQLVPPEWPKQWLKRTKELIDKTQPDKLWFDFGIERPEFEPYRREIAAYYYNKAEEWGKEVVLTYKNEDFVEGTAVLDIERGRLTEIQPLVWQTDTSVGKLDWSYNADEQIKDTRDLINEFEDIVSNNGVLLLNIGPHPDGTVPQDQVDILLAIGQWLKTNGEAIYGTRPWVISGEGPTVMVAGHMLEHENFGKRYTGEDIRFTTKGDAFYAIFLDWPGAGTATIKSLKGNCFVGRSIADVELLGHGMIDWKQDAYGLHVEMPEAKPCEHSYAVKVTLT